MKRFIHKLFAAWDKAERIAELETLLVDANRAVIESTAHLRLTRSWMNRRNDQFLEALDIVRLTLTGGNHLGLIIGDDFVPYTATCEEALEHYGAGDKYEIWNAWRNIMIARDRLQVLRGGLQSDLLELTPLVVGRDTPSEFKGGEIAARKKPVTISAFKMTEQARRDNRDWPDWMHRAWNTDHSQVGALYPENYPNSDGTDRLRIKTLEGDQLVSWGDVIIRGVQGEIYPCKPDIFAQTYEVLN